jgi:hypothetical protein
MKRLCSALATLFLLTCSINAAQSASAEDDAGIAIAVEVLSSAGAPKISVRFSSPIGKRSDAAKVSIAITGLEPNRAVFFVLKPLPDAFARVDTDNDGALKTKVELPYGLEPGLHEMVAQTTFGEDETPAEYTLGELYVNDLGVLTNADGSYPKGTRPVKKVLPNSAESFATAPTFNGAVGSLRISEPQLRISQSFLPTLTAGITFNNSTAQAASFEATFTLVGPFGIAVGKPYFATIDSLPAGESQTVLLNFAKLAPLGFFTLKTELILPADFVAGVPVATSQSSAIFVPATLAWSSLAALLAAIAAGLLVLRRLRMKRAHS